MHGVNLWINVRPGDSVVERASVGQKYGGGRGTSSRRVYELSLERHSTVRGALLVCVI